MVDFFNFLSNYLVALYSEIIFHCGRSMGCINPGEKKDREYSMSCPSDDLCVSVVIPGKSDRGQETSRDGSEGVRVSCVEGKKRSTITSRSLHRTVVRVPLKYWYLYHLWIYKSLFFKKNVLKVK